MSAADKEFLRQSIKSRLDPNHRPASLEQARLRAIQPYTQLNPEVENQLWNTTKWSEVVELHKKEQPLYATTLINAFLIQYHN